MQEQGLFPVIVCSLVAAIFGFGGLFRGWQMGYQGRLDLISDWDYRPLPNPAEFSKAFAHLYIGLGGVCLAMPFLLFFGLKIFIWAGIFAVIIGHWSFAIDAIAESAASKNT